MKLEVRRGTEHPNAKLTDAKVRQIRKLREQGKSVKALAGKFKVSERTIEKLLAGRIWKHVE